MTLSPAGLLEQRRRGPEWLTVNADSSRLVPGIRIRSPRGATGTVEAHLWHGDLSTTHAYSWSGSFYGSGSFSSATSASGKMGLSYYYVYGCGYVSAGPYETTYAWQHAAATGAEACPPN